DLRPAVVQVQVGDEQRAHQPPCAGLRALRFADLGVAAGSAGAGALAAAAGVASPTTWAPSITTSGLGTSAANGPMPRVGRAAILSTTSMPLMTLPNTA